MLLIFFSQTAPSGSDSPLYTLLRDLRIKQLKEYLEQHDELLKYSCSLVPR